MEHFENVVYPGTAGATTCGYCSAPGRRSKDATNFHAAALDALKLSCSAYQAMIDRGWRRSGTYCYKPDLKLSCCPQYTIKLDSMEFKPSRSHRQLINRWNRYVLYGDSMDIDTSKNTQLIKALVPKLPPFTSLSDSIHFAEKGVHSQQEFFHTFEVILEPSSYTPQKYALYQRYQEEIHDDRKNSPSGFRRFLVESPLQPEPIPYTGTLGDHLPKNYGSYHQLYKLDGQLIAMGVVDILPKCVSSVYFMYNKTWERFSLGKLSTLREVSLGREIREAGISTMEALYMGFYIHSCPKMRYKGEYCPSYLADPETYKWYPLQSCIPLLEKYRYACFSDPSHSSNNVSELDKEKLNAYEYTSISAEFDNIKLVAQNSAGQIITLPIKNSRYLSFAQVRLEVGSCIRGLGHELSREIFFTL